MPDAEPARILEVERQLRKALIEIDELRRRLGNLEAWAQSSHAEADQMRRDIEALHQAVAPSTP